MNGRSPEDDNNCVVDLDVSKQVGITKKQYKILTAHIYFRQINSDEILTKKLSEFLGE